MGGKMVKTILTIVAGCVIAGILGLFVFFAVSAKSNNCCGSGGTPDNNADALPPCCTTTTAN